MRRLGFSALQRAENSSIEGGVYTPTRATRFSALQRAENSSISAQRRRTSPTPTAVSVLFSEPKIPQSLTFIVRLLLLRRFSALQRAENSSIIRFLAFTSTAKPFQCSSASRKFLNASARATESQSASRFSALQRAENSSMRTSLTSQYARPVGVSVLFSEPKIPQYLYNPE